MSIIQSLMTNTGAPFQRVPDVQGRTREQATSQQASVQREQFTNKAAVQSEAATEAAVQRQRLANEAFAARAERLQAAMLGEGLDAFRNQFTVQLNERVAVGIDRHLAEMAGRGAADRRNGSYSRWLMSELGEIELAVPRTRSWSALTVVRAYARRAGHINRVILACFVLGLPTRKVAIALLPILGRRISAATVSAVAKTLDAAVAAFHRRPLKDIYPTLMLDGVVLARRPAWARSAARCWSPWA